MPASSPASNKRKAGAADQPVSPPPVKRKIQSGTTQNAVANFFKPASQKPKDRTQWAERGPDDDSSATLLVGKYEPESPEDRAAPKRRKIAAFDLDSTLISTASGKKHSDGPGDWKWWHMSVPARVKKLYHDEGYRVVIFSNQAGLGLNPDPSSKAPRAVKDRRGNFKQKCAAVLAQLDLPATVYAATGRDSFRKPRTGMWAEFCDDYDLAAADVDLEHSFFVGDAGGRTAVPQRSAADKGAAAAGRDFSCSDRNFAYNVGVSFKTPEEFFLGEKPRAWAREFDLEKFPLGSDREVIFERKNARDIVVLCGPPGAGKSTFYWKQLKPLEYERVNQDLLKSRENCIKAATEHLRNGKSVAIDNTNADPGTRAVWIELAKKHCVPARCVWFRTPLSVAEHNDAVRSMNKSLNPEARTALPRVAFSGFASRFKEPKAEEGFQEVSEVEFRFRGSEEEYAIWGQYWT